MSEILKEGVLIAEHGNQILAGGEKCMNECSHGMANGGNVHNLLSEGAIPFCRENSLVHIINVTSYQDKYSKRLNEEKQVRIYYIPVDMHEGHREYMYVAASALLHDKFMEALEMNQIPDFAVVVLHGKGYPDDAIKQKMKAYYGYDHDLYAAEADEMRKTGTVH